ncbi:MAG: cation transporter [Clostridia bacterium]|nr:cation transporter [Clostridia bacterium]
MDEKKTVDRVSRVGIFGNILLSAFKLAAGILGSSGAMVSDAVHSLSDVFATFIAWIGVRLSRREEDKAHPYGHERLECVASLLLGLILAGTGAAIGYGGIQKLLAGEENIAVPTVLPLIAAIVSIAVKEGMYHYTMHYAKLLGSDAFRADAWHHRSDAISSVGSFIGIGLAKLGIRIADPIASLLICVLILKVAFDIIRDSIRKMLDTSCSAEFEEKLRSFVANQEGVLRVDLLRTRQFGNRIYIDLEIAVDPAISLRDAHGIAERVHSAVEKEYHEVKHVMIHVNPAE